MSLATWLAACAGALAAAAVAETAALTAQRRAGGGAQPRLINFLRGLGTRLGAPAAPADLRVRLQAAGSPLGMSPSDVMAVKAGFTAVTLAAALPVAGTLPGRLGLPVAIALPLAAFLTPDHLLRMRARARGRAVALELPDLLDLLRVCVEAGLPVNRALAEAASRHRGLLATEWRASAARLELGVPRAAALATLRERCPHPAIGLLTAAIERSERHGAPLARTLRAQAAEARAERARATRERAARAAPKIQLVVALMLVPSVLLLVAAAMADALLPGT